jgi:NADH dehydrogenase (ubiquinone) Fe-S protein 4
MNNQKEALIYQTQKSATQSGVYKSSIWFLKFVNFKEEQNNYHFDVMNWQGGENTLKTIFLKFSSKEDAIHYAEQNNINYRVVYSKKRYIKPKSYASNFD